jgi:hypothetical protein
LAKKKCFPYGLKNNSSTIQKNIPILSDILKAFLGIAAEPTNRTNDSGKVSDSDTHHAPQTYYTDIFNTVINPTVAQR